MAIRKVQRPRVDVGISLQLHHDSLLLPPELELTELCCSRPIGCYAVDAAAIAQLYQKNVCINFKDSWRIAAEL